MQNFVKYIIISFLFLSCSKPNPYKITLTADLPQGDSSPVLKKVVDYGTYQLPNSGKIKKYQGDGKVYVGELLLLRGTNFGRLPTVTVAGKPTPVLLRLGDGGIMVRVPVGVSEGVQKVIVATNNGITAKKINIIRVAAAQASGSKQFHLMNALNWRKIKDFKLGKVKGAAFHKTMPLLYVLVNEKSACKLITIDLSTLGGPKKIDTKKLKIKNVAKFGISGNAKLLWLVNKDGVQIFNLEAPVFPRPHSFQKFTGIKDNGKIRDFALSPDGKTLAIIFSGKNLVKFFDVQVPDNIKESKSVSLLTDSKVPLLKRIYFTKSKSFQYLWVLTGDTEESLKVGYHPSSIFKFELKSAPDRTGEIKFKKDQNWPMMKEKVVPSGIDNVKKGSNKSEDAALNKWSQYYYLSLIHSELLTISSLPLTTPSGLQKGIETLTTIKYKGVLHRLDYRGKAKTFYETESVIGSFKISADGKTALMAVCTPQVHKEKAKVKFECGIRIHNLNSGRGRFIKEGKLAPKNFVAPFNFGITAIQD